MVIGLGADVQAIDRCMVAVASTATRSLLAAFWWCLAVSTSA
jgi:hypothetical protein